MNVYMQSKKIGYKASGEYNPETKECTVFKGSILSKDISTAPTFKGAKSIEKARQGIVKNSILQSDITFKSSSTAGNFVSGRSTDGFSAWKTEDGTSLKKHLINSVKITINS